MRGWNWKVFWYGFNCPRQRLPAISLTRKVNITAELKISCRIGCKNKHQQINSLGLVWSHLARPSPAFSMQVIQDLLHMFVSNADPLLLSLARLSLQCAKPLTHHYQFKHNQPSYQLQHVLLTSFTFIQRLFLIIGILHFLPSSNHHISSRTS